MVNKVTLIGNVGNDPEVRVLENGVKVARISLATTERYTNAAQEKKEHTEWHYVTFWRGLADVVDKYVKKGSQIYVEGKLRTREWEDPTTHQKRSATEILADEMKLLGRREGAAAPYQGAPSASPAAAQSPVREEPKIEPINDEDDLPF